MLHCHDLSQQSSRLQRLISCTRCSTCSQAEEAAYSAAAGSHNKQVSQLSVLHVQARAGGGRLPQLYEAKVHLQLRLGLFSRLLALVGASLRLSYILLILQAWMLSVTSPLATSSDM